MVQLQTVQHLKPIVGDSLAAKPAARTPTMARKMVKQEK
jgi:hypothetical protein